METIKVKAKDLLKILKNSVIDSLYKKMKRDSDNLIKYLFKNNSLY